MGVQQMAQQRGALRRVHLDHALADVRRGGVTWRDVDALRLIQQLFRQRARRGREGGGEQQVLAVGRQQGQHAAQFVGEAEVEQAVGFVQHQGFDGGKPQRIVRQQVQQPAGRGGDNVGAAAQGHHCGLMETPPKPRRSWAGAAGPGPVGAGCRPLAPPVPAWEAGSACASGAAWPDCRSAIAAAAAGSKPRFCRSRFARWQAHRGLAGWRGRRRAGRRWGPDSLERWRPGPARATGPVR